MVEIWKDIIDYEGLYQVSNMGRVKGLNRVVDNGKGVKMYLNERLLKFSKSNNGYLGVVLCKNGKVRRFLVHRLVASAFVDNPCNKPQVNHLNEVKDDNRAINLNWMTRKENINYGSGRKRLSKIVTNNPKTSKAVIATCLSTGKEIRFPSMNEIKRQGFNRRNVWSVLKGRKKSSKGYTWRYE